MNKSLACNMDALSPGQRQQRADLFHQLKQSTEKVRELADGYAFSYAKGSDIWMTAATFIDLERRCCPFFTFSLKHLPEEPVQLQMTGPQGVKAFMENQFDLQSLS